MKDMLLDAPESRFKAALELATSEFHGGINLKGYDDIPNPYYSQIYASAYFDMIEDVLEAVRVSDNDELAQYTLEIGRKAADHVNEEAIESAKIQLSSEVNKSVSNMPEPEEHDKIEEMWNQVRAE